MHRFRRSRFARSCLLPFTCTIWLAACHKWVQVGPPLNVLGEQAARSLDERDEIRLHFGPERTLKGRLGEMTPDSLVIVEDGTSERLPTAGVTRVDVRRADVLPTLLLLVGTALVVPVAVFAVACTIEGGCGGT